MYPDEYPNQAEKQAFKEQVSCHIIPAPPGFFVLSPISNALRHSLTIDYSLEPVIAFQIETEIFISSNDEPPRYVSSVEPITLDYTASDWPVQYPNNKIIVPYDRELLTKKEILEYFNNLNNS